MDTETRCPCGSGETYGNCCYRYHDGFAQGQGLRAPTPLALMRSRFTAFALELSDYLLASWHPASRPASLELDKNLRWYRLDILSASGGPFDTTGRVKFAAYYRSAPGTPEDERVGGVQQENSRFEKVGGEWFYLDGELS